MMKFATFVPIAACFCVVLMFGVAGADAKGGRPGFHSFLHHEAAHPSRECGVFAWAQGHRFARTPCLHHARYGALH
jgi:hypothetical protein